MNAVKKVKKSEKTAKNVHLSYETHKLVKTYCANAGVLMKDFCEKAIIDAIETIERKKEKARRAREANSEE
jgi:hypothetical protein